MMNLIWVVAVIATSMGSAMALSPLLQVRRVRRTGSSRDVSLAARWVFVANAIGWVVYGGLIGSLPMVIPNSLALMALSYAIVVVKRHRGRSPEIYLGMAVEGQ